MVYFWNGEGDVAETPSNNEKMKLTTEHNILLKKDVLIRRRDTINWNGHCFLRSTELICQDHSTKGNDGGRDAIEEVHEGTRKLRKREEIKLGSFDHHASPSWGRGIRTRSADAMDATGLFAI